MALKKHVFFGISLAAAVLVIAVLYIPLILKVLLMASAAAAGILGVSYFKVFRFSVPVRTAIYAATAVMIILPFAYGGAWVMGLASICGDSRCDISECQTGCAADCSGLTCADGICQTAVGEDCQNSNDCSCQGGYACQPSRNGTDSTGCFMVSCGDGYCDTPETQNDCCSDCGCPSGYNCQNNQCALESLSIAVAGFQISGEYSATTLYTNPELHYPIMESGGIDHPLMTVTVKNNGQTKASNVQIGVKVGSYTDWSYEDAGNIQPSASEILQFNPVFTYDVMGISEDETVQVDIKVTYDDIEGVSHTSYFSKTMKIISREWINWEYPGFITGWITPNDPMVRSATTASTGGLAPAYVDDDIYATADRVWSYFNGTYPGTPYSGIQYVSDPRGIEFVQFPAQTLRNQAGDCEDLAVLYASALESVGIQTYILLMPGHAFMAFCSSTACDSVYPVETTMMEGYSLEQAITQGNLQWDQITAIVDTTSPYISPPSQM